MSIHENNTTEAFESGWRVGALSIFHEIERIRERCEYPEDLEMEIDEWIDAWKTGRRFLK